MIPSYGGQSGRAEHEEDGGLQNKFLFLFPVSDFCSSPHSSGTNALQGPRGGDTLWTLSHTAVEKDWGVVLARPQGTRAALHLGSAKRNKEVLSRAGPKFSLRQRDGLHLGRVPFLT